jgi:hypothetical protein
LCFLKRSRRGVLPQLNICQNVLGLAPTVTSSAFPGRIATTRDGGRKSFKRDDMKSIEELAAEVRCLAEEFEALRRQGWGNDD